jgi:hypothetical protein
MFRNELGKFKAKQEMPSWELHKLPCVGKQSLGSRPSEKKV